jgi:Uma2 family endonuclease
VNTTDFCSLEDYLTLEQHSEIRHEYVDGKLYAMAGESKQHEEIVLNVVEALRKTAKAKGCRLQTKTIQLRVSSSRYRYPDVMVNCLPDENTYLEENPCFILEVLSNSTSDTDSNIKLGEYTRLPNLQRYVLVEQHSRLVVVYKRQAGAWVVEVLEQDGVVDIPCLETTLSLEQIYDSLEM